MYTPFLDLVLLHDPTSAAQLANREKYIPNDRSPPNVSAPRPWSRPSLYQLLGKALGGDDDGRGGAAVLNPRKVRWRRARGSALFVRPWHVLQRNGSDEG